MPRIQANDSKRMLFVSSAGLESAKKLIVSYKNGDTKEMSPELWRAKQIVDSTLHPGTNASIQSNARLCRS